MKKKVLIKNAKAIVTVDKQDRVLKNENILIEGNQIKYIGKEEKEADESRGAGQAGAFTAA